MVLQYRVNLSMTAIIGLTLSGCQLFTPKLQPPVLAVPLMPVCQTISMMSTMACLPPFQITGKIGLKSPAHSGSAFYAWSQRAGYYQLMLTGILGIGQTNIVGTPTQASLENSSVGSITASDPEALLQQATGWQAPISALPFWIMGQARQQDATSISRDPQGRLIQVLDNGWLAQLNYMDNSPLPNKINMTKRIDDADYRVIFTIGTRDEITPTDQIK